MGRLFFFFSSRRRHTRLQGDWSSDVCSSDLDVWNRTEVGISVSGTGSADVLGVAACEHARADRFPVGHFTVRDASGRFIAELGGGGPDPNDAGSLFLVLTAQEPVRVDAAAPSEPL